VPPFGRPAVYAPAFRDLAHGSDYQRHFGIGQPPLTRTALPQPNSPPRIRNPDGRFRWSISLAVSCRFTRWRFLRVPGGRAEMTELDLPRRLRVVRWPAKTDVDRQRVPTKLMSRTRVSLVGMPDADQCRHVGRSVVKKRARPKKPRIMNRRRWRDRVPPRRIARTRGFSASSCWKTEAHRCEQLAKLCRHVHRSSGQPEPPQRCSKTRRERVDYFGGCTGKAMK